MTSPQTRPLGAQISHMLKARGVDTIFGIPGVHNVEMYRGIEEAGITHVLARHEQGAGFMADGYARASGKPGVAYVITGPGLCNIMTAMGQAYSDSVSMLVLSSCLDEVAAKKGQLHQMLDQEAAAATVCDWSHTALTANAAYTLIDRALTEFETARPRPKHIQVPIAVLGAEAEPAPDARPTLTGNAPAPDLSAIAAALKSARLPVFVFGGGAAQSAQVSEVNQLLANTGAAAFTTYAARGLVAPDYALNFGAYLAKPGSADIFAKSDLVIAIGTELAEVDLWRDALGHDCPMIRVDIAPQSLSDMQTITEVIQCDAGAFVTSLLALFDTPETTDWRAGEITDARTRWRAETDAARPGIVPIIDTLRAALPEDTMIFSDMTQIAYVGKEVWDMTRPNHWHHPFGFGTLGYALPAAIGGAIARKGAPTIALVGDYGFHYTMQELGVAVELGLPLPIILWDNGKLKEIEDSMVRSQIAPNAVIAQNPDFLKLAEAFGAQSVEPSDMAQLSKAVQHALRAEGPTMIRVTPQIKP
ncbi:MAG: 5-guanidino-2-oxopentanoate decarboxylase [Rhodobacterales bacterium]|nr:5-guanidino-2-oxopentanoate decarboxylase [Rhodobacterales bacterium]